MKNSSGNLTVIDRIRAVVKWYNPIKGFGFLTIGDGEADIFLHSSLLQDIGYKNIPEGTEIECEIGMGDKGKQVIRILKVDISTASPDITLSPNRPEAQPEGSSELTGTIKWFNPIKGFGFIIPDDGGSDVFIHASELRRLNVVTLQPGQKLSMKVFFSERGREAHQVKLIG